MSRATSRRDLFRGFANLRRTRDDDHEEYFDSYESAYPLLNAAGQGMLREEAARHGIATDGKSDLEIAREIFARQAHPRAELRGGDDPTPAYSTQDRG